MVTVMMKRNLSSKLYESLGNADREMASLLKLNYSKSPNVMRQAELQTIWQMKGKDSSNELLSCSLFVSYIL